MPAFDGRDGACGRTASRVISDPSLGRGKLYVCPFHAAALLRVRRRARSAGGAEPVPGSAVEGRTAQQGTWRAARARFKPPERSIGEYLIVLMVVISAALFASLFIFGPRMFDAVDAMGNAFK